MPGEVSFPPTPLPQTPWRALHIPPRLWKGKEWAGGTEPRGAPREDDLPPMGTGLRGLLQAGILLARNNCLSSTAQLPQA